MFASIGEEGIDLAQVSNIGIVNEENVEVVIPGDDFKDETEF